MRLAAYLRVSTSAQAEDGYGLDVQEKAIRKWAKDNGHRIVLWARDEGVSGTKEAADRPALADAVNLVCERRAQGLVVHRLDRLARQLTVQEGILAHVWQCGGSVFAVDTGEVLQDDPDDPMRTFIRQVMGAVAQLERAMIAARLRAGRRQKAEQGGYAGGGPPLGFRAVDGELVPDPDEAATRARIYELRGEGLSLRLIAQQLTDEGHTPKRSNRWHPETVAQVLRRAKDS
jgi:DNA invertase Pin-like site-specific DNA recombinase